MSMPVQRLSQFLCITFQVSHWCTILNCGNFRIEYVYRQTDKKTNIHINSFNNITVWQLLILGKNDKPKTSLVFIAHRYCANISKSSPEIFFVWNFGLIFFFSNYGWFKRVKLLHSISPGFELQKFNGFNLKQL